MQPVVSPEHIGNVCLEGSFRGTCWPCVVCLLGLVASLSSLLRLAVFCMPLGVSKVFQMWTSFPGIPSLGLLVDTCFLSSPESKHLCQHRKQNVRSENKDSTVQLPVPETQLEGSGKWH